MAQASKRVIDWIEGRTEGFSGLRVPEGRLVGQVIKLRAWQKKEIRRIYDNPARTRRAILSFGRKNGKTALAAMLLLVHLIGPMAQPNSQLYSAAQSREQASILFNLASKMVRMNDDLSELVTVRDSAKQLFCEQLGTLYRALSADATTAYGLSPVFAVHDELGQVRGPRSELYEAIETGMSAHEAPMSLVISTQAPTDDDLLSRLIDDALAGMDKRIIVSLYTAPEEDAAFIKETVKKANPAFGDFQNEEEVMMLAKEASRMPSREAEFRNLILNQRVETNAPLISKGVWDLNKANPAPMSTGRAICGGLDLSEVNDLTACIFAFEQEGIKHVHSFFWLPEEGLIERSKADRVPYDQWAQEGHIRLTPGATVDYKTVGTQLADFFERFDVRKIAFDRWNMRHLRPWLIEAGLSEAFIDDRFVAFGQGYQSMSPAIRIMEGGLLDGTIAHGDHPVLKMCAANAIAKTDEAGNRKLDKKKSNGRIDGIVGLTQALAILSEQANDTAVFETDVEDFLEDALEA